VPRQALWCVLQKYDVPNCLVDLLCSFHDRMAATGLVGGEDAIPFEVKNGLRQDCTIVPTLFILYFEQVFQCWLHCCDAVGVKVLYKIGGKFIGERTRRPSSFVISECLFVDNAALIFASR